MPGGHGKDNMKLGFIGLGNMATAMIGGILKEGIVEAEDVLGSAVHEKTRSNAQARFGIHTTASNREVAENCEIVILAVKPVQFPIVLEEIMDCIDEQKLLISVAAGRTTRWISEYFNHPVKIVRCMPNTPALVQEGCSAVCRNENVSDDELQQALEILRSFGTADVVKESLMDVVVGVSGSSPAYVFMFIEAMADAAVKGGMPRAQAYQFAAQSVMGSAKLMLETGRHPGELKDMVCSPAGTTIEAVEVLEKRGFRAAVMEAVDACIEKSRNL